MSSREGYRRAAEHALAAIRSDPSLGRRVADSYSGRHTVGDALWWAAHPGSVAPSGIADPATELRQARAYAYSREGQSSGWIDVRNPATGETVRMREAEARVIDLERQTDADAVAVDAVLAIVAGSGSGADASARSSAGASGARIGRSDSSERSVYERPLHEQPQPGREQTEHPGSLAPPQTLDGERDARASAAARRRRRRGRYALPAALVAAGLVVGVALSTAILGESGGNGIEQPASRPLGTTPPRAIGVFDREATDADVLPTAFVGTREVVGRRLYSDDTLRVWAYREGGEICLVYMDGAAAGGTCAPPGVFAAEGITLPLPDTGVIMSTRASGSLLPALTELTWEPDGAIVIRATPLMQ